MSKITCSAAVVSHHKMHVLSTSIVLRCQLISKYGSAQQHLLGEACQYAMATWVNMVAVDATTLSAGHLLAASQSSSTCPDASGSQPSCLSGKARPTPSRVPVSAASHGNRPGTRASGFWEWHDVLQPSHSTAMPAASDNPQVRNYAAAAAAAAALYLKHHQARGQRTRSGMLCCMKGFWTAPSHIR